MQQGDTVLVHAGAGGVGLILTQWATSLAARVITTVSTPGQGRTVPAGRRGRGARLPRGVRSEFGDRIRELTDGNGVAAVYDGVGASTFDASLASLAVRGTLALFGAASGPVPPVDPQRLNAAGSVYLTRPNLAHLPLLVQLLRIAGDYESADKSFRIVLESVKVLPAEICYYFGANSYYLKRYKQSINWLNKYIELKGTAGQYFEVCSKILKLAEQEYLQTNTNQEPSDNLAKEESKKLSGLSEIDCDSGVRIICPVCMGKTVIIKKGLFGNEYRTCPYCDDHGTLSCEEYNLLLKGELKPRNERETAENDQK